MPGHIDVNSLNNSVGELCTGYISVHGNTKKSGPRRFRETTVDLLRRTSFLCTNSFTGDDKVEQSTGDRKVPVLY